VTRKTANWIVLSLALCVFIATAIPTPAPAADHFAAANRVADDIRYLASDELEGRGPGTEGLQKAADYIRDRFGGLGLSGVGTDGSHLRPFEMAVDTRVVVPQTSLVLRGPDGQQIDLALGKDYQPLATGGSGAAKAPIMFAGYGISAAEHRYDDYRDADVKGKVVLIIRREPQQDDPRSVFKGKQVTAHAYIRTKLQTAKKNGAAAVLMVNDPLTTNARKKDELAPPNGFGTGNMGVPFAHLTQTVVNRILAGSPVTVEQQKLSSVQDVSDRIDETLAPLTQPIEGWTAELRFKFEKVKARVSNVLGVIEGEGPRANETIVIGAHYDHLGYGPFGSRRPNERAIHNGADDNASGTAAIMELARRFAQRDQKPARRLIFVGFTAEERGIVGSNYYLEHPPFPLENTVAMLNFDMIGNLRKEGLLLGGVRTGRDFGLLVDKVIADGGLKVKTSGPMGGSDHLGFHRKGIPVLFFFTGLTDLYHTPDDDFETLNVEGVVQTIDFAERLLDAMLQMPQRPQFVKASRTAGPRGPMAYLGIVPDYAGGTEGGLRVTDVNADSPASKGGLRTGDVIIKFAEFEVRDIQGLAAGLRKYKSGQQVEILVRREDDTRTLNVMLGEPPNGR
jgi:hypothetical protein